MPKMDQVHILRHKVLKEGQSIRRVARELRLSRNMVAKHLDLPEPVGSSRRQRERPVWEAVRPRLEELVAEWEPRTTAKQRITAMRLHRQPGRKAIGSAGPWWVTTGASGGGNGPRFTYRWLIARAKRRSISSRWWWRSAASGAKPGSSCCG
jgi:hypothetical protein